MNSRRAAMRLYHDLFSNSSNPIRQGLEGYGITRKLLLQRMGLRPRTPVRTTLGGISLILLGSAAGAALAWWLSPEQVKSRLQEARARGLDFLEQARGEAQSVAERPLS
jgi:hypothetical protein